MERWRPLVKGVTTNPRIIMESAPQAVKEVYRFDPVEGVRLLLREVRSVLGDAPVSVEILRGREEALRYHEMGAVVKVPTLPENLSLIWELSNAGVRVNATIAITVEQVLMASLAGAYYVSIFFNRVRDYGGDPLRVVREARELIDSQGLSSRIIVGSIRAPRDVIDAMLSGAHIVTVPPGVLSKLCENPGTRVTAREFEEAWSGGKN